MGGTVCMMSGLLGHVSADGSKFMVERTVRSMLDAVSCLVEVQDLSFDPSAVFWKYVSVRAQHLELSTGCGEELAFARLAVLTRTVERKNVVVLEKAWAQLVPSDRIIITGFLLADGIKERALLLSYLPLFLANAKQNQAIGLFHALEALVDVLEMTSKYLIEAGVKSNATVNLSELAHFTKDAVSLSAFEVGLRNIQIRGNGDSFHLEYRSYNTSDHHQSVEASFKKLARSQERCLEIMETKLKDDIRTSSI